MSFSLLIRQSCLLVKGNDYLARVYISLPPLQLGVANDVNRSPQSFLTRNFLPSLISSFPF